MEYIELIKGENRMTKKEFIEKMSSLQGVGKVKAEYLYNNGYNTIEKIKNSSIEDLIKIKGINEQLAINIKDQLNKQIKNTDESKHPDKTKMKVEDKKIKDKKKETELKKSADKEETKKEETDDKSTTERIYIVKKKPKLTKEITHKLKIRKNIKKRTPKFLREEWFRYKRIPKNWRKPDGITSKMRRNLKYRPNKVRVGYRGPKEVRNLHSSGFEEVLIHNIDELLNINNSIQAIRIGSKVGTKKRNEIQKKADELEIRILNTVRGKNE
jgi:large subunit ribosomal protein L32e